ncbi:MAG TPA: DNA polymerase III subunit delta' C-terminal domain-containing protein [Candidatus Dormibacteraeota bacterium]|nr:DNA polymerase III subunit delta' C-terminal domain-containing protein [Candidatus Dormibacteraeota bacterium]
MGFSEFLGNERIIRALRGMLQRERVPSAMLFTGPRGVGKYTLARMFAQAANCERLKDDFCGECASCLRVAPLANPTELIAAGLTERGESADAAAVERTPLIIEPHPDVWLIVPDPVRLRTPVARPMIRVGQLRAVQRAAYFQPLGRRRVFILDGADTMRWDDADLFLKILEEPPDSATLILLAQSPDAMLPTIRSRCLQFQFAPAPAEEIEQFLKDRSEFKPADRRLAAQLSAGSPGAALSINLEESKRLRTTILGLLQNAVSAKKYNEIFAATAQLSKQEKESFENILSLFYSLLTDLLEASRGNQSRLPRNPDLRHEIESLAVQVDWHWVLRAVRGLDTLEARLRRNIGRQLGLDSLVVSLGA